MRKLLFLIPLLLFAGCVSDTVVDDTHPVMVSMLCEPVPIAGEASFTVAWRFRIAEGWHLYWDGLNDSGAPPVVTLDLPDGWSAGPLRWPTPERHVSPGEIIDHVYFDELVLLQDIATPTDRDAAFAAKLEWLACRDLCVFGDTVLVSTEIVGDDDAAEVIKRARAREPITMPRGHCTAEWRGASLHLKLPQVDRLEFMPSNDCGPLADLIGGGVSDGTELNLDFLAVDGVFGPACGLLHGVFGDNTVTFMIDIPATSVALTSPEDDDG